MNKFTRRGAVKTGLASVVTAAVITPKKSDAAVRPKSRGETKVVYLGGDQLHNGMGQRQGIRSVLSPAGWRVLFTSDARYVTPEFISDADLLIITRWGGAIEGWSPEPIQEEAASPDGYMSDELEDAIVDNVINRGMGFMALHCTCWTPDRQKFNDMMGIEGIMHGPVQTVFLYNFNQNHPVTKGIKEFHINLDENFGVKLTNPGAVKLFNSFGMNDKRQDIAGWCLENGKGRVVGLVAGHTPDAWRNQSYRELYWRGAHWAMKRDIPPFPG
ncbi:ThuA domain-containing protein [Candidatus Latescibacterota bacterium]